MTSNKNNKCILPIAVIGRLIRQVAMGARISSTASRELGVILEQLGLDLSTRARDLAAHAGRTTVRGDDIQLAYKQWTGQYQ